LAVGYVDRQHPKPLLCESPAGFPAIHNPPQTFSGIIGYI